MTTERLPVDVQQVRVEPYRNPAGAEMYMVHVDWRNASGRPVRTVHADVRVFDDRGEQLYAVSDYTIYAEWASRPGVAPGASYTEPAGQGHIVPNSTRGRPSRATAAVTRASEHGLD